MFMWKKGMYISGNLHKNLHFCGAFSSWSAGGVFPKMDVLTGDFWQWGFVQQIVFRYVDFKKNKLFSDVRYLGPT